MSQRNSLGHLPTGAACLQVIGSSICPRAFSSMLPSIVADFTQNFGKSGGSMGGYGSRRSGGRPTVEDSLTLNLLRLFKTEWLKLGAWTSGTLLWSNVSTGEETASMGCLGDFVGVTGVVVFWNVSRPAREPLVERRRPGSLD